MLDAHVSVSLRLYIGTHNKTRRAHILRDPGYPASPLCRQVGVALLEFNGTKSSLPIFHRVGERRLPCHDASSQFESNTLLAYTTHGHKVITYCSRHLTYARFVWSITLPRERRRPHNFPVCPVPFTRKMDDGFNNERTTDIHFFWPRRPTGHCACARAMPS